MSVPLDTRPESLERMRRNVATIDDPVAFARRYLHVRGLTGKRDEEALLDVAVESIVKAAITWHPRESGGVSLATWCYRYMDREVFREVKRDRRRLREMEAADGHSQAWHGDWLLSDGGQEWFARIEQRIDLQRWADLAELSDHHRWVVEYLAYHMGTYVRDTEYAGEATAGRFSSSYRQALKHMREAAVTGERRDDRWTRARNARKLLDQTAARAAESGGWLEHRTPTPLKIGCDLCDKRISRKVFYVNGDGVTRCYTCHTVRTEIGAR